MDKKVAIHISSSSGKTLSLRVDLCSKAFHLKQQVLELWGIPLACQRLLANALVMDDSAPLSRYKSPGKLFPTVNLVVSHEAFIQQLGHRNTTVRNAALEALVQWACLDHGCAMLVLRMYIDQSVRLTEREGFIPQGGDLLVETMTVDDAKLKCLTLPGCRGFTFRGVITEEPVKIFFKNKSETKPGEWTSMVHNGGNEALKTAIQFLEALAEVKGGDGDDERRKESKNVLLRLLEAQANTLDLHQAASMLSNVFPEVSKEIVMVLSLRILSQPCEVGSAATASSHARVLKLLPKLATKGDDVALEACCKCLKTSHVGLQVAASKALQALAPHRETHCAQAIDVLCTFLESRDVSDSALPSAVKALAKLVPKGHARARAVLQSCLDNPKLCGGGRSEANQKLLASCLENFIASETPTSRKSQKLSVCSPAASQEAWSPAAHFGMSPTANPAPQFGTSPTAQCPTGFGYPSEPSGEQAVYVLCAVPLEVYLAQCGVNQPFAGPPCLGQPHMCQPHTGQPQCFQGMPQAPPGSWW